MSPAQQPREVLGLGVRDGQRAAPLQQQIHERLAHQLTLADQQDFLAGEFAQLLFQHVEDSLRRARQERAVGLESVHIFVQPYCLDGHLFIEALGQRQLDDDAAHTGVVICDPSLHNKLVVAAHLNLLHRNTAPLAVFHLAPHVGRGGGVITTRDDDQPLGLVGDLRHLLDDLVSVALAVNFNHLHSSVLRKSRNRPPP